MFESMVTGVVEFVSSVSVVEWVVFLGIVVGVLEEYLRKEGTRYDSYVKPVYNVLSSVFVVLQDKFGSVDNSSDGEDEE